MKTFSDMTDQEVRDETKKIKKKLDLIIEKGDFFLVFERSGA